MRARLTDTPLQMLIAAQGASPVSPSGEVLARAYLMCPRAKAIVIAALQRYGGDYDDCADMLSNAWMVLRDKYAPALSDSERIYQLTAAIAERLAKRSAEGVRHRSQAVPLSVIHGKGADADDYAAFSDHVERALDMVGERAPETIGIAYSHEAEILLNVTRARLQQRFANLPRPSGVRRSLVDEEIVVAERRASPSVESQLDATDTDAHPVLARLRHLSICSGMTQEALFTLLQWDKQHWNDVLRKRDAAGYDVGPRRSVRRRDLDALVDVERQCLTPDVLALLRTLQTSSAVDVAVQWGSQLGLAVSVADTNHQRLLDIDQAFASLGLQCARWRLRVPTERAVVRAYLRLRPHFVHRNP